VPPAPRLTPSLGETETIAHAPSTPDAPWELTTVQNGRRAGAPILHEWLTIIRVRRGSLQLVLKSGRLHAEAGQIIAIPADEYHVLRPASRSADYDVLRFDAGANVVVWGGVHDDVVLGHVVRMVVGAMADPLAQRSIVPVHVLRLVERLRELVPDAPGVGAGEHRAVTTVRAFLSEHYTKPVTLRTLAAEARVSSFHLIKLFRSATGVPPYAYVKQLRMRRARALLRAGTKPSAVAYQCGFSDQSHFTRDFVRLMRLTPRQFMRGGTRGRPCANAYDLEAPDTGNGSVPVRPVPPESLGSAALNPLAPAPTR
jgi:AraC-like DNA-binding protein